MTDAIGPGSRLRFVGWREDYAVGWLTVGRVYVVQRLYQLEAQCPLCEKTGHWPIMMSDIERELAGCPCGFRPEGDEPAAVAAARRLLTPASVKKDQPLETV